MTNEEALTDLWHYVEAGLDQKRTPDLVHSWLRSRIEHGEPITPDLFYAIADDFLNPEEYGEHSTPKLLSKFIGALAQAHPGNSLLDPTCGQGLLLHEVARTTGAKVIHGIDINADCRNMAQAIVGNRGTILFGDALSSPDGIQPAYDLIIANAPFAMSVRGSPNIPHLENVYRGDMGYALAVWACARLSNPGVAMLTVTSLFIWSTAGIKAQAAIKKSGCHIRALIHLPGGTFPHTSISSYLAVFERGEQQDVFIGEYSDDLEAQKSLIENYKRRKTGDQPSLGRLCALSSFRGFDAFVAQERLKRLVRSTGWPQHNAETVIIASEKMTASDADQQTTNSVWLRLIGRPSAHSDSAKIPTSLFRDSVRLGIDPKIADARYLAHWFNRHPLGQTTVDAVSQGGALSRIDLSALMHSTFCLPPLSEQRHVLAGIEHLNRVRAEALELESALWSNTEKSETIVHKIRTINQEDRYEDWIETLPFPLASILWRHHAGGGSMRDKYEVLLHFFEATAAFIATIHLSAFMSDDALWSEVAQGLRDTLAKQRLSLEQATFGTWKLTVEYFSGRYRKLQADDDGKSTCARVYGTANLNHVAMICHADLLSALQRANSIRNKTKGHGGAIGPDEATHIHDQLMSMVHTVRGVFGRSWLDYELIQPGDSRYQSGVHHYKAKRLMGTRSAPFETIERDSTQPLEVDRLYLFDAMSQRGLLLRPFIRVMPSPERKANACFIFSRSEKAGSHFVSYHFEDESSLTASFPDVDETLRRIHLFDDRVKP